MIEPVGGIAEGSAHVESASSNSEQAPPGVESRQVADKDADCEIYRPIVRPPMGLLYILDDGSRTNGESIRMRGSRLVIGRQVGDILIPHDASMSDEHAEILREKADGRYRWSLRDMQSTNGTFVRIAKFVLKHNHEVLLGSRRYQYRSPEQIDEPEQTDRGSTQGWKTVSEKDLKPVHPTLVEVLPTGDEGVLISLTGEEVVLGSDEQQCTHALSSDPFLSKVHVRISRTKGNRWTLQDAGSANGTWLKISTLPLDTRCEFQLGEQRFAFQPL